MAITKPIICFFFATTLASGHAQGFVNLNFELARIPSGTQPATFVPISEGMPGWSLSSSNVSTGVLTATQVVYDGISSGGPDISIDDTNAGSGSGISFVPLQGKFSAMLFGASGTSVSISQTGLVPVATESLQFQISTLGEPLTPFIVMLGGQIINTRPLADFSTYTEYGGDVSAFAGQTETLTFTQLPPASMPPSILVLDNIQFLTSPVPEPGTLAVMAAGAVLLGLRRGRRE